MRKSARPVNPNRKKRPCLKCSRQFLSEGRFNRVCYNCQEKNHRLGNIRQVHTKESEDGHSVQS